MRKLAFAILMTALLAPFGVSALGLGGIHLHSALNQPLDAEIDLLSVREDQLHDIQVELASGEAFARAGVDRPFSLSALRFEPMIRPDGRAYIKVTTRDAVREPFLSFLVEVNWSRGRLVREYTVLLDLPTTRVSAAPAVRPSRTTQAAPSTSSANTFAAPSQSRSFAPGRRAPVQNWGASQAGGGSDVYGAVRRNETLWTIAGNLLPDQSVSVEQMMMALVRVNPEAFQDGNANLIREGSVLRVPDYDEVTSMSRLAAKREFLRQTAQWRELKSGLAEAAGLRPMTGNDQMGADRGAGGSAATSSIAGTGTDQRLRLVAPDMQGGTQSAAAGESQPGRGDNDASFQQLRAELAIATETAETTRLENAELRARLTDLESQLANMQRLFSIRDDQLAALQSQAGAEVALEDEASANVGEIVEATEEPAPAVEAPIAEVSEESSEAAVDQADSGTVSGQTVAQTIMGWLTHPYGMAGIGALAVLVSIFGIVAIRRRRQAEMEEYDMDFMEDEESETDFDEDAASIAEAIPAADDDESGEQSYFGQVSSADIDAITEDSGSVDPMTEADVYIAYGRYEQAEDLLASGIQGEPDRIDLKLKLLEVYHATRKIVEFETLSSQLQDDLPEQSSEWQKIVSMGRELNPGSVLFEDSIGRAEESPFSDSTLSEMRASDDVLKDPVAELESELDQEQETSMPAGDNVVDFELANIESRASESAVSSFDHDEVATKLDLARAYLDIGDAEGARSILDEVLEQGSDQQKGEANALLQQIS